MRNIRHGRGVRVKSVLNQDGTKNWKAMFEAQLHVSYQLKKKLDRANALLWKVERRITKLIDKGYEAKRNRIIHEYDD